MINSFLCLMFTRQLGCGSARAAVLGGGRSRTGSPRGSTAAPCEAAGSGEERDGRSSATRPVLEVEDESDKWGPPDSESICGAQLSESRERQVTGRGDISHHQADWAPACLVCVACHMRKSGKIVS